jgi:hypothetical protein
MTAQEVISEIKPLASDDYKKILLNHGVREPCLGVKIADLKKVQKRVKKDYRLALDLYDTGIYDAMYLAGMIADERRMTRKDLQRWAEGAYGAALGTTVSSVTAGTPHGHELALEWIDSPKECVAVAGWLTLSSLVATKDASELNVAELKRLLQRVQRTIHQAPNGVRYVMNAFVIAVGSYVSALTDAAIATGEKIGEVKVDMGNTACKVPFAPDYIRKVQKRAASERPRPRR